MCYIISIVGGNSVKFNLVYVTLYSPILKRSSYLITVCYTNYNYRCTHFIRCSRAPRVQLPTGRRQGAFCVAICESKFTRNATFEECKFGDGHATKIETHPYIRMFRFNFSTSNSARRPCDELCRQCCTETAPLQVLCGKCCAGKAAPTTPHR